MNIQFKRPSILSDEEWKIFDPTMVSNNIFENIEKARNKKEFSEQEIIQIQTNLINDLYNLIFLINQNLEWFQEQELTQLIRVLDTAQPSSSAWEKNREFAFELLNYISLIQKMSIQAHSAAGELMFLNKK